jgi:cell division protein FtsQ
MTAPVSLADRVGQRLRQPGERRRPSRVTVLLVALGATVVLGLAAWLLLVSSLFGVARVQVQGQGISRVRETDVVDAANIVAGTPLARLDTAAVAARVGRIPAVGSVDVLRDWPRGVTIVIHERVPAAVRERGTGFVLVDRTGVVFGQVATRPKHLPLVSAPVSAGAPALRAALDVLGAVPPSIRGDVRSVRAASPDEVTVQLTHHRTVVWGDTGLGSRKGAVLAVLLTRNAAVYDVSVPDAPTTRH